MRKSFGLLVGDETNFHLPLIEVPSFKLLRLQVLDDLRPLAELGSVPWWAPKGSSSPDSRTFNWPSFGRASKVAECYSIGFLSYTRGSNMIDLTSIVGMLYVAWLTDYGWCVYDKTDGGWIFGSNKSLPSRSSISELMLSASRYDTTTSGRRWLSRAAFNPVKRSSYLDNVGYSQELNYGGTTI